MRSSTVCASTSRCRGCRCSTAGSSRGATSRSSRCATPRRSPSTTRVSRQDRSWGQACSRSTASSMRVTARRLHDPSGSSRSASVSTSLVGELCDGPARPDRGARRGRSPDEPHGPAVRRRNGGGARSRRPPRGRAARLVPRDRRRGDGHQRRSGAVRRGSGRVRRARAGARAGARPSARLVAPCERGTGSGRPRRERGRLERRRPPVRRDRDDRRDDRERVPPRARRRRGDRRAAQRARRWSRTLSRSRSGSSRRRP